MLKLVCDDCYWSLRDRSMMFKYVVSITKDDIKKYRYIKLDMDKNEVPYKIEDHLVDDGY